jgi:hypothetical protein
MNIMYFVSLNLSDLAIRVVFSEKKMLLMFGLSLHVRRTCI